MDISCMLRRMAMAMAVLCGVTAMASAADKPDFAFPKQVSAASLKAMAEAVARADGPATLRAVIDYDIAQCAVDADSLPAVVARIDSLAAMPALPVASRAMLSLLAADIYAGQYQSDRWTYNRRNLPLDSPDPDFRLWSGDQFRKRVYDLIGRVMADADALKSTPVGPWLNVLTVDSLSAPYFPTLFDFAAYRAIDLAGEMANDSRVPLSKRLLCPAGEYVGFDFSYMPDSRRIALQAYADLLEMHRRDAAPYIRADINRLEYVAGAVGDGNTDARRLLLLRALYDAYADNPYGAEALIAVGDLIDDTTEPSALYRYVAALRRQIDRFPKYVRVNALRDIEARLTHPQVSVSYPLTVVPGDSLKINVRVANARDVRVDIYRVAYGYSGRDGYQLKKGRPMPPLVATLDVPSSADAVPFSARHEVKTVLAPGCYIVVPRIGDDRKADSEGWFDVVHCTSLQTFTSSFAGQSWAAVVNPSTGQPVGGATLTLVKDRKAASSLKTPADGVADISSWRNGSIFASKGADSYAASTYAPYTYKPDNDTRLNIQGYTSLAVYHPGDSVEWAAVAQRYKIGQTVLADGIRIDVDLFDANNQKIDSASCRADRFGRVSGKFAIPKEGLNGQFRLRFVCPDNKAMGTGSKTFTVSDYRMPTFEVRIDSVLRDVPQAGAVTVKGRAVTYSGFSIDGCETTLNLVSSPRLWWRIFDADASQSMYTANATAADGGSFSFVLPAAMLELAPGGRDGLFNVIVAATAPSGETQQASRCFTLGKPYVISSSIPSALDVAKGSVRLPVSMAGLEGNVASAQMTARFLDADSTVAAICEFKATDPVADMSKLRSGVYTVVISAADSTLADPVTVKNVAVYRPDDKYAPVADTPLWVPVDSYTAGSDGRVSILYGITAPRGWVRYVAYSDTAVIARGWLDKPRGLHRFDFTLPQGVDKADVRLYAVSGYESSSANVSVVSDASVRRLDIAVDNFRDHVTPGQTQTWRIRTTDRQGRGVAAAVMLDIYSRALDAVERQTFALTRASAAGAYYSINGLYGRRNGYHTLSLPYKDYRYPSVGEPQWLTWGMQLVPSMVRDRVYFLSAARSAGGIRVKNEAKMAMTDAMVEEASVAMADDMLLNETVAVAYGSDAGAASAEDSEEESASEAPAQTYRPAEIPLAMFAPMITTGADGEAEVRFTAPDANTTWQMYALAFDSNMTVARRAMELLASKPVMVQPNLPRFMRMGDVAQARAMVMNNTDSVATVKTVVELFDPADGAVISTFGQTDTLAPRGSAVVTVTVKALEGADAVGYRVRSATDVYSDGEQRVVPVLPAVTPVIESIPFYLGSDEAQTSVQLPAMPGSAAVTLTYCANPVWYVATALPGIRADVADGTDAVSAATILFSAAMAEGILRSCPEVAEALRMWTSQTGGAEALQSALSKNPELKTLLLNCTPWVADAQSDTERMARLALLFDSGVIRSTYASAIGRLSRLQSHDGGLRWFDKAEQPSEWATERVLTLMGRLNELGFMPADRQLARIVDAAVRYIDRETEKYLKDNPRAEMPGYVALRDMYPAVSMSASLRQLRARTVKSVAANWRNAGFDTQAMYASILKRHGYPTMAAKVVESLRQHSVSRQGRGMWWPNADNVTTACRILRAFHAVDPKGVKEEDAVRQWLVMQKKAQNWGSSWLASDAVATIMLTGTKWTVPARQADIYVGDRRVTAQPADSLLGNVEADIAPLHPSGATLRVDRVAGTPAWGSVFCRYTAPTDSVMAADCGELSIEKTLLKAVDTPQGVKWAEADSLRVGDRVLVTLTVDCRKTIDYVAISDGRGACFEPVEQTPRYQYSEGVGFYLEPRDASTQIFISRLPKGLYRITYDVTVNTAGEYISGIASIQSQYDPSMAAHSSGRRLTVEAN